MKWKNVATEAVFFKGKLGAEALKTSKEHLVHVLFPTPIPPQQLTGSTVPDL